MVIFGKENLSNSSKRCKLFRSVLKEALSSCNTCNRCLPFSVAELEDETPIDGYDDVQELVVSIIRSRAMEAKVRKKGSIMNDGFSLVVHPSTGEVFVTTPKQENKEEGEEIEDFMSVQSHLSHWLSADSEAFFSVNTNFSCCLSLKGIDFAENEWWVLDGLDSSELQRRAIIQEVCHCQGWPFGLCRKALLLPPLPKSPSDSWTWCKGTAKMIKTQ